MLPVVVHQNLYKLTSQLRKVRGADTVARADLVASLEQSPVGFLRIIRWSLHTSALCLARRRNKEEFACRGAARWLPWRRFDRVRLLRRGSLLLDLSRQVAG